MKKIIKTVVALAFVLLASCSKDDITDNSVIVKSNNKKVTGSSSHDILSENIFKSMVVEIVYVEGFEPTTATINNFVSFLNARINKSDGILIEKRAIASPGKTTFTDAEIVAFEDANRTKYNTSNQIAIWALFIDGKSSKDTSTTIVLGTAYRNTSFVIFENTIHGLSDSPFEPNRSVLETTVISHEFGHVLGLVNLGAPLQSNHEDTEHIHHCNVSSCLMHWSSETGQGISNMVSGGSVPQLDAQCIADLHANGGK